MSMGVDKLVGLRFHGGFYTGIIFKGQQKGVDKKILGMRIPRIGRMIMIWEKVVLKIRVFSDGLVISKKVLSESSHRI